MCADWACGRRAASTVSRSIAATSALVSRWWFSVAATTNASSLIDEPLKGVSSLAATLLGMLAGRYWVLLLFTDAASDGRNSTAATVPPSQTATTSHRERMEKRPRAANSDLIYGFLAGDGGLRGVLTRVSGWAVLAVNHRLRLPSPETGLPIAKLAYG